MVARFVHIAILDQFIATLSTSFLSFTKIPPEYFGGRLREHRRNTHFFLNHQTTAISNFISYRNPKFVSVPFRDEDEVISLGRRPSVLEVPRPAPRNSAPQDLRNSDAAY